MGNTARYVTGETFEGWETSRKRPGRAEHVLQGEARKAWYINFSRSAIFIDSREKKGFEQKLQVLYWQ